MALSMTPIVVSGAPVDAPFDTSNMEMLKGDGGIYELNTIFTELKEGKKDKELCDGSWGRVVYVSMTCEACDPKTHDTVGKVFVTLFLNTKSHFLASQVAAFCGCYNKEKECSEYNPKVRTDKEGKEHWSIPALEKKTFIAALARSGSFINNKNESVDQYQLVGVLSTNFVTAAHFLAGKVDRDTALGDYKKLQKNLEGQIKYFKEQEKQQRDAAIGAGAGASYGGMTTNTTYAQGDADYEAIFANGGKNGAAYVAEHGTEVKEEPKEPDTTQADPDIPF